MPVKKYIVFLLMIVLFVSCKDDSNDNDDNKDINISAILDLSGHYSQFGAETRDALTLMGEMNNELEITFYDSQGLSSVADSLLNLIIAGGTPINIVTLLSWISNDLAEKIDQHDLLQFPIGSAAFSRSDLLSSVLMTENVEDESTYLTGQLTSYDKIAMMYFNNDYGISWFSALSGILGDKVITSEEYSDEQTDFTAELTRIALTDPEVVILISTREAALILNQAAQLGLNAQFYGTRPILTNELLEEPASDGLVFSYPKIDYSHDAIQTFQSEYGYKPGSFAAEAIDLCISLINAASQNKYLRDEVIDFLKNSTQNGTFYSIHFDEMCRASYEFTLMRVENGSFVEMK